VKEVNWMIYKFPSRFRNVFPVSPHPEVRNIFPKTKAECLMYSTVTEEIPRTLFSHPQPKDDEIFAMSYTAATSSRCSVSIFTAVWQPCMRQNAEKFPPVDYFYFVL
jgi:hypothetical protein